MSQVFLGDSMYVFGGKTESGDFTNDVYAFDFPNSTWRYVETVGPKPSKRSRMAAAVDEKEGILYITGGWNGKENLDDMFALQLKDASWCSISSNL